MDMDMDMGVVAEVLLTLLTSAGYTCHASDLQTIQNICIRMNLPANQVGEAFMTENGLNALMRRIDEARGINSNNMAEASPSSSIRSALLDMGYTASQIDYAIGKGHSSIEGASVCIYHMRSDDVPEVAPDVAPDVAPVAPEVAPVALEVAPLSIYDALINMGYATDKINRAIRTGVDSIDSAITCIFNMGDDAKEDEDDDSCFICTGNLGNTWQSSNCACGQHNKYCCNCVSRLPNCPICRQVVTFGVVSTNEYLATKGIFMQEPCLCGGFIQQGACDNESCIAKCTLCGKRDYHHNGTCANCGTLNTNFAVP